MKEYLTYQDLIAYELAGITEIAAVNPINRFPEEKTTDEYIAGEVAPSSDNSLTHITNLDALLLEIKSFDKCFLKKTATNTVFGAGNPNAKIMFVGDAPGAEEDKKGLPFAGKNGELLEKMLGSIGLEKDKDGYYVNIIPWRPPGNRLPSAQEVNLCLPFLKKHIELVNPDVLVFLGGQALNALVGGGHTITKARGQWFDYVVDANGKNVKAFAMYHPAFLMRSPAQKKQAWQDLLSLQDFIKSQA